MNSSTSSARVLVVEDDPKISRLLVDCLEAEGLSVDVADNGQVAVNFIRHEPPALVLLDLMLPGLNGVAVCRSVRPFYNGPIIMLTARIDEIDRLMGLDSGADDYVCKPFSPREVMARVKAQLRRLQGRVATAQNPWSIDDERHRIAWQGQWLELTRQEFRLFRLLLARPGHAVSRGWLYNSLQGDNRNVGDHEVDIHLKTLQGKLQAIDPSFACINPVYGVGYRFDCPHPAPQSVLSHRTQPA
ncbi:response regulator [Hydrogenophaga sp. PAMC20947]|uniref:response regulator n=1 Tax=Hydrogenophaga sp. PAMC20947 TaxID=2565558 RepID=UPI00109D8DC1|nr:response regulator [Hydrogenophaga sp. PAMC20947]QCB45940.1 response regulator [Hydrogenophaga sp. PAMC20947]